MNRRGFLCALATTAVGAFVAAKIPTSLLPMPVRRRAACEYLLLRYRAYTKGQIKNIPRGIIVGRDLFEAYESELTAAEIFSEATWDRDALRFKNATITHYRYSGLHGWDILMLSPEQWDHACEKMYNNEPLEWTKAA